jgi:hypothetical protein
MELKLLKSQISYVLILRKGVGRITEKGFPLLDDFVLVDSSILPDLENLENALLGSVVVAARGAEMLEGPFQSALELAAELGALLFAILDHVISQVHESQLARLFG